MQDKQFEKNDSLSGEDVKSYSDLKQESKSKKPVSQLAKNSRSNNLAKARQKKIEQAQETKRKLQEAEEQKVYIEENKQILEKLKKKVLGDSESDQDDDDDVYIPKPKQNRSRGNVDNEYIANTLRNIEKRVDKLYTMKKMKKQAYQAPQPVIVNTGPGDNTKTRNSMLHALAQSRQTGL